MGWKINLIIDEFNTALKLFLHIDIFYIDKLLVICLILVLVFRMPFLLLYSDFWKVPQCRIRCDFSEKKIGKICIRYAHELLFLAYMRVTNCIIQLLLITNLVTDDYGYRKIEKRNSNHIKSTPNEICE